MRERIHEQDRSELPERVLVHLGVPSDGPESVQTGQRPGGQLHGLAQGLHLPRLHERTHPVRPQPVLPRGHARQQTDLVV